MNVEILDDKVEQDPQEVTQAELKEMCDDAISQLKNLSYNETVDVSLNDGLEGTD